MVRRYPTPNPEQDLAPPALWVPPALDREGLPGSRPVEFVVRWILRRLELSIVGCSELGE
jgi:hypothetical protein